MRAERNNQASRTWWESFRFGSYERWLVAALSLILLLPLACSGTDETEQPEAERGETPEEAHTETEPDEPRDTLPPEQTEERPATEDEAPTQQEEPDPREAEEAHTAEQDAEAPEDEDHGAVTTNGEEPEAEEPESDQPESESDRPETAERTSTPEPHNGAERPQAVLPPEAPSEVAELFHDLEAPADPEALHAYLEPRITALDEWVDGEPWSAIGEMLETQRREKPLDPAVTILWAWYLVREKGPEMPETVAVLAEVADVSRAHPENVWARLALVHRDIHADPEAALAQLEEIVELRPRFALAWRVKAELHMLRNERELAREAALESIALAGGEQDVFGEISVLGSTGHVDELRELLDEGALPYLSRTYARLIVAQVAMSEDDLDEAVPTLEAVLEELESLELNEDRIVTHRDEERVRQIRSRAHLELAATAIEADGSAIDWPTAREHLDAAILAMPEARDAFLFYLRLLRQFPNREIAASLFEPLLEAIELRNDAGGTVDLLNIFGGLLQMVPREQWPREKMWRATAIAGERMRLIAGEISLPREAYEVWIGMMKLCLPYRLHDDTRLALPLAAGSLDEAREEDLVRIVDWLVQLVEHGALAVAMDARMWLGLIVRESGVREEALTGYAQEVLRRPVGTAVEAKGAWASVLAVTGNEAHAHEIVEAMQRYIDAEQLQSARRVFRDFHRALRHLLDPSYRTRFNPRRASLESLADLTEAWRNKLP